MDSPGGPFARVEESLLKSPEILSLGKPRKLTEVFFDQAINLDYLVI